MSNENQTSSRNIPGFPKSWTFGFQFFVLLLLLGGIAAGVYYGYPYLKEKGVIKEGAAKAQLRGGFNNFVGFAPGLYMNGGAAPNKESRMYKEHGVLFEAIRMDDMQKLNDGLKNGDLDFIFTTTDISPISMDKSSDLAKMNVMQFLKIDDSRGADVFIVDDKINTIADLKGKKIACALGWPSNTLLHATLEAGGLTEKDVKIIAMADPFAAKQAFVTNNVDATVVWSPDDEDCLRSRPSKVLTSTSQLPNIIMDGFVARKEVLEKKKELFTKFSKAWLQGNAEVKNDANKMAEAATIYKTAFEVPDDAKVILDGMKKINFSTYGDNLNFFGLNTDYTGITGQQLYTKMARAYKNSYGNNLNDIVPWAEASYPSIVSSITGMEGKENAAEGQIKFTPSAKDATAKAIATKPIIINFETNSSFLTPDMKDRIERELGQLSVEFGGMKVRIEGNTDNVGNASYNKTLSYQRAKAVADYLVNTYKFDKNRFVIVGNGQDKPIADNSTEQGKASNRRTEFQLLEN